MSKRNIVFLFRSSNKIKYPCYFSCVFNPSPLKQGEAITRGFPDGSAGKESACNVGDLSLIPGLGRSPGEGKGYHYSILAWRIPWTV